MTYEPSLEATLIKEQALSMKISVDALLAVIEEDREEFRSGIKNMLQNPNLLLLNLIRPDDLDDVQQEIPGQSPEQLMERLYAHLIKLVEIVREKIDGLELLQLRMEHFQDITDRGRSLIFAKILDIATSQSISLLDMDDEIRVDVLIVEAKNAINKALGFTRVQ